MIVNKLKRMDEKDRALLIEKLQILKLDWDPRDAQANEDILSKNSLKIERFKALIKEERSNNLIKW